MERATFGSSPEGYYPSAAPDRRTMDNIGAQQCTTDKNNKMSVVSAKECKMRFNSVIEACSVSNTGLHLKSLKNSINENTYMCLRSEKVVSHLVVGEKCQINENTGTNKHVWDAKNEAEKARRTALESNKPMQDKLSLLRFILPERSRTHGLEKSDFEKQGNQAQWNIGLAKEDICGKLLSNIDDTRHANDTIGKLFDAVTLKNNLNTICQLNDKSKSEKIKSLFMDREQKISNEVSVICMYFTKDSTCTCKVGHQSGEAPAMAETRCDDASGLKRSSTTVASRGTVRERREIFKDNHGNENSSSSESFTSRSFSKLHIISKAVCFPFSRPSDRSWCCVRNRKRKNRLRSRVPKARSSHSPCPSTSRCPLPNSRGDVPIYRGEPPLYRRDPPMYRGDPPPYRCLPSTSRGIPCTSAVYLPLYNQVCEGRQCGANTGDSKGSGGTSPGQQDSGDCQSGSIPSGGGGRGGAGAGGASGGGGGGGQRGGGGGGGSDERWWPPDNPDVPDADEKDGVPEKNLNDVDKGGDSSIRNELNLNISGDASLSGSSIGGGSTKAVSGGRCTSGELSDEDNNSALLMRQGPPGSYILRKSPAFTDGPELPHPERKGSLCVHSRVAPSMVETALALFDPSQNFPSQVIQEMKPLRHSMFTEINKCLRHCFDKDYLATAFKCGMCLSLSAMIRHVGRCGDSRSKCKACDHVSNILKMHVRRCLLLEIQSTDNVPQRTDSGTIMTGLTSSLLTSVSLACPVDFCVKLRKKLKSSRSGNHQAHLEMVWGKEDLWQMIKKMVAYLYDIEVDYEMEAPEEDMLDSLSLSLPVPSVTPSRILKKTLIENFKKGLMKAKKKKPEPPAKPKKVPPKIPPKPKFVLKKPVLEKQEVKESLVLPEAERRVKTSPRRRLLGAVRDSDIIDDLYGPGAAQMSDMSFAASGAGAAASGPAEPSAPPLPHEDLLGVLPHMLMAPTPMQAFLQGPVPINAQGVQALVTEFIPDVGQAVSSMDVADLQVPGEGQVEYGSVEDLHLFVNRVHETMDRYESGMSVKNVHEGIILEHMQHCLSVIEGRYAEGEGLEWVSIVHLGSGVTGRCWLIMDGQTHFQACVKRVDLMKFDKREVEVWSSLYHRQVADLYGVIVHENEVLMFAEFIDGGTLAEVIARYAEDRVLYGETDDVVRGIDIHNSLFLYQQLLTVLHYFMQPDVQVLHEDIKADNVMIRAETSELVLVDFGLARHLPLTGKVPWGESPSGAQTHWSPEKAASEGYSFSADWWAATCVLLECITTKPPWLTRYAHLKMLHFVIKMNSPPLEDVPVALDVVVRDLIKDAWTIDPNVRPPPIQQAKHPAFSKYEVPYMVEDDPDSGNMQIVNSISVLPSVGSEILSSSGSSTITSQPSLQSSLQSDPTQAAQMRKKKSDAVNSELQKSTSTSPDNSNSQDSSEQSSETLRPRLSVLLQPPSDPSPDNYTNTGARPKTYDQQSVSPSVPPPAPLQSRSVEEEQHKLVGELIMMTCEDDPNYEKNQELFERVSSSSKGEDDSASNYSDDLSLHFEPLITTPVDGTLIEFRKTNSDHLCSIRVKNLKQRWRIIIKTASVKIHTHFQDFAVYEDIQLMKPLRPDLEVGAGPTTRNVFVVQSLDNWLWKCAKGEIVYNQDKIPNGEIGLFF